MHLRLSNVHHAGFAGADYDLQDALVESTNKSSSKAERNGQSFYDYELAGPVRRSLKIQVFLPDRLHMPGNRICCILALHRLAIVCCEAAE